MSISNTVKKLRACNQTLRQLTDQAPPILDRSPQESTLQELNTLLDQMIQNLSLQFQIEEAGGFMAGVYEKYPNWHPQVEHLRQQHCLLRKQLQEIRDRLVSGPAAPLTEVRRQMKDWINTYNEHQAREASLIQDAFILDTGAGE